MQRMFIKKCFLFMVGSVCRVKRFTAGPRNVADFSLITKRLKRRCGSGWDNSQNTYIYAAGFDALVKRWEKCINVGGVMSRNKCFSPPGSNINHMFYVLYPFVTYLLTVPRNRVVKWITKKARLQRLVAPSGCLAFIGFIYDIWKFRFGNDTQSFRLQRTPSPSLNISAADMEIKLKSQMEGI
jgi:hypothetical protein